MLCTASVDDDAICCQTAGIQNVSFKNLVILKTHIWPSFIKRVAMETEWLVCMAGVRKGSGTEFARARGRREEVPLPRPSATFALFARPKSPFSFV